MYNDLSPSEPKRAKVTAASSTAASSTGPNPPPLPPPPAPAWCNEAWDANREWQDTEAPPPYKLPSTAKAPPSKPPKAWHTLTFDIANWESTLDEFKVDACAKKELWLLAQYDEHGAKKANQVISKLLKMVADGRECKNPRRSSTPR